MATIDVKHIQTNDSTQYKLNDIDDVLDIAEQFPSLKRKLVGCQDMQSMVKAILKYFNSHSGMHAKLIGNVNDSKLYKSEMSFEDRFDAWLYERSKNERMYDTGWKSDPGDQRKPEKKKSWIKTLFNMVGHHEN